jgi:hypothetical protein
VCVCVCVCVCVRARGSVCSFAIFRARISEFCFIVLQIRSPSRLVILLFCVFLFDYIVQTIYPPSFNDSDVVDYITKFRYFSQTSVNSTALRHNILILCLYKLSRDWSNIDRVWICNRIYHRLEEYYIVPCRCQSVTICQNKQYFNHNKCIIGLPNLYADRP